MRYVVVTGGGSGGHTSAALAVARALRDGPSGTGTEVCWVTSRTGIERSVASANEIESFHVSCGPLPRALGTHAVIGAIRTFLGVVACTWSFTRRRPSAVISFGGYVAAPAVISSILLRIPLFVHEQTAAAGTANRLAGVFARLVFLSHRQSERWFQESKCRLTGNPVREEVYECNRRRATLVFGLADALPIIYITGGAQGATEVNRVVWSCLESLLLRWQVIHQIGNAPGSAEQAQEALLSVPAALRHRYYHTPYIDANTIGCCYSCASIVVGRSGAGTTSEIRALGLPCVLIPYPFAGRQEQLRNAEALVSEGLGVVIPSAELSPERLISSVVSQLASRQSGEGVDARPSRDRRPEMLIVKHVHEELCESRLAASSRR